MENKKGYVIYHRNDLDGFCSGALAKLAMNTLHGIEESNIVMMNWDYGDEVPDIPEGAMVFMTDISFPTDDMLLLLLLNDLTWIDHHRTAIDDSRKYGYHVAKGVRREGDSASLLAWEYWYPGLTPARSVYWVDRYDVWKQKNERGENDWDFVLAMQYGMRLEFGNPNDQESYSQWVKTFAFGPDTLMVNARDKGMAILEAEKKSNKIRCAQAFDLVWEGHKFAAINNNPSGSVVLDSYLRSDHDGCMVFYYSPKHQAWKVSLYGNEKSTQEIDFSIIAKKYGGGGHAHACGFILNDIGIILKK